MVHNVIAMLDPGLQPMPCAQKICATHYHKGSRRSYALAISHLRARHVVHLYGSSAPLVSQAHLNVPAHITKGLYTSCLLQAIIPSNCSICCSLKT